MVTVSLLATSLTIFWLLPPEPLKNWNDILFATKKSCDCIQLSYDYKFHNATTEGEEDCLYLNIYVPVLPDRNVLLPVIFSIYGGGFRSGSAYTNVTFLMDRNVIFVSANYRVGVLGFISTEDEHIPGNMGLKDQSMALDWISKNIKNFGGNPKKITLFGQSAGAASVHYHYLSPLSKGLFQNGISLSGSSLAAGKFDNHPLEKFKKLGTTLKCPMKNISDTVECLRSKSAEEIIEAEKHFLIWLTNPINPFSPVVEKHSPKPFINRPPVDIIMNGDVADLLWIDSIVSEDGLYSSAEFIEEDAFLQELDTYWNNIAPHLLMYNSTIPAEYHNHFSTLIRKHYFGNEKITKSNVKIIISLMTDRLYCSGALRAAKLQAKVNKSPVLFLYYNYRALTSFSDVLMKDPQDFGVCHADDLSMILGNSFIDPTRRPEDRAVQIKLIDLVVSVATDGYPNIGQNFSWNSVDPNTDEVDMLHFINSTNFNMERRNNFCEHQLWNEMDIFEN